MVDSEHMPPVCEFPVSIDTLLRSCGRPSRDQTGLCDLPYHNRRNALLLAGYVRALEDRAGTSARPTRKASTPKPGHGSTPSEKQQTASAKEDSADQNEDDMHTISPYDPAAKIRVEEYLARRLKELAAIFPYRIPNKVGLLANAELPICSTEILVEAYRSDWELLKKMVLQHPRVQIAGPHQLKKDDILITGEIVKALVPIGFDAANTDPVDAQRSRVDFSGSLNEKPTFLGKREPVFILADAPLTWKKRIAKIPSTTPKNFLTGQQINDSRAAAYAAYHLLECVGCGGLTAESEMIGTGENTDQPACLACWELV